MSIKHRILNQQGVSLIQVMIAGAMMVGIAVVGMKIMDTQSKMTRGVQQSAEATSFYSLVTNILSGQAACTNTFTPIADTFPAMGAPPLDYNNPILDARGTQIFVPGRTYGTITFVGMQIINDNFDTAALTVDNDSGIVQVRLNFRRDIEADPNERKTFGTNEFSRVVNLFVELDPATGNFRRCYDVSEDIIATVTANVCADLGGVPDPDTLRCDTTGIFTNPENLKTICEGLEFSWDEVEVKCNKYVRGAHYGGCSKELLVDTTFKGTYNQVWPVLNCSTNPPTCDTGFKAIQMAGGLVNVTPFGDLRAEMSTIWETWACAKE